MTYLVNPLPNTLLYNIFYFKSLEDDDVQKYIESIIGAEFPKGDNDSSENSILRKAAINIIFESHKKVREINGISSVSLRDLQRFKRAYKFFNDYFIKKKEKLNKEKISNQVDIKSKILSFILSIFITYYIRILEKENKGDYERNIINNPIIELAKKFKLKEWLNDNKWEKAPFKSLVMKEEEYLLKEMGVEREKGIGLNNSLKENIFLMFFSIYSHIPLIVVGKPGCSKSLSIQLIIRLMRGEFSTSNFLKKYPTINSTGFQGSETNTPESIEKIFKEAEKKLDDNSKVISLLVFDELGLSEKSPTNCLKVLHSKLEMTLDPKEQNRISFIGISNWKLDAAKMNRAIFLAIPDITLDDIKLTVKAIADSYKEDIYSKYEEKYGYLTKLAEKFDTYKDELKKLPNEFDRNFHGGRDLYHLVKTFSKEMLDKNMPDDPDIINEALKKSFARNLNGFEINGESTLKKYIKDINFDDVKIMDLIKDNLTSKDTRFLLLFSEKSMFGFLVNIIQNELEQFNKNNSENKEINYVNYIGSPFKGDRANISYQTEIIVKIENSIAQGKVIILSDLDQIYSIFYDLFNQNYIIKDNKKYCRISHGANIQKLAYVNDNTKFIVLIDKNNIRKQRLPFLSRFEKYMITYDILLNDKDKEKTKKIQEIIKKMVTINGINYNMENLLVNTNEDIINGYTYLYKDKEQSNYKNIIEDKIAQIIPQDIILALPLSELSKQKNEIEYIQNIYYNKHKYNNSEDIDKKKVESLEEYLKSEKKRKEQILIVYTFSNIGEAIDLTEKEKYMERIASEITTVYKFKQILDDFYEKNYESLILKFNHDNAIYINYFISEIKHYKEINRITNNNKKFIFIINIQREFNLSKARKKVTTVLMSNEEINQLFIDNINGIELSIKDIEEINISDYVRSKDFDSNKVIIDGILKFYGENINEQMGNYKGIDYNNFIKELTSYIKDSDFIKNIKNILLSSLDGNEKIVDLIIKNKYINQNTVDFSSAILAYLKEDFNTKLQNLLMKSENNNFFITLFMLNIKDTEKKTETNTINESKNLNDYTFNKNDDEILKNNIISKIKREYLAQLREKKIEEIHNSDKTINSGNNNLAITLKIYYKIPGFFNIYREIKKYIQDEKLALYYRQNEGEVRKCEFEYVSQLLAKLKEDTLEFTNKVYTELISKPLVNKVVEAKTTDEHYIEFCQLFLNDYITFYLVSLYKNVNNDFVINDIPHQIILLLLELKFKDLKEKEEFSIPLQSNIAKILWLEANANYIKNILYIFKLISENILYGEKNEIILFKEILNHIKKNNIIYKPEKEKLIKVNSPYYIISVILFKCMIDKKSIERANACNDNYFSYFEFLEIVLKEMGKLDKLLILDIKELSILKEFITIYKVFQHSGKLYKLDINELINNLTKSLEIIEKNDENKIGLLSENLKVLIDNIEKSLYDASKNKEIKGDKVYYKLVSDILLNELKRENNKNYKLFILKEFLLKDEKLFIQSIQILKIILDEYVSNNINLFQNSLNKLKSSDLKELEKKADNEWIKETLKYIFEQISIIYIQNYQIDNENSKKHKKIDNILIHIKNFFEHCIEFLEKEIKTPKIKNNPKNPESNASNKDTNLNNESEETKLNINLQKIFALSFTRIYLKTFIDWIDKDIIKSEYINEIIKLINGKETNEFRDMLRYYIYKIIYNTNEQDIAKLFEKNIIEKYHLEKYNNFDLFKKEKDNPDIPKHIVFIESYKNKDEDFTLFKNGFDALTSHLNNSDDKTNELEELSNKRCDIFYSVVTTRISAYLSKSEENQKKINNLFYFMQNTFDNKEKLRNIFELFLDKSKYNKRQINKNAIEILKFCLKFCINADEICEDYDNIYYPIYNERIINSYIPGNDIKGRKIYLAYSKFKKILDEKPNSGVYMCFCNINNDNENSIIYIYENGYPSKKAKCQFCKNDIGSDGRKDCFIKRNNYFKILRNKQELEKETKNKETGNCITLEQYFEKYLNKQLEKDSRGVNVNIKPFFDQTDKPIRNQSQIGYRLMNLILYSHLFTNVLSTNVNETFVIEKATYLDYILWNWNKLEKLLEEKSINIYAFMNLIHKDLFNFLNKQKRIETYQELLKIEKEIENIIESKIIETSEKTKEGKECTKYNKFGGFYLKIKNDFRLNDEKSVISIVKESNSVDVYKKKEKEFPYYKSLLYSDYPDEQFLKTKLEETNQDKYPVINLYLNRKNYSKGFSNEFITFNFVIKSLLNQYFNKISRDEFKRLKFENSNAYKTKQKNCEKFINIINSKNQIQISKESKLEDLFSIEACKLYGEIYEYYAKVQNELLNDIVSKINIVNYSNFESQEINIKEAQKDDLIKLEFENKSEFTDILLTNTFREFYNKNSKIKYNNYNLYSIDFDKIEEVLEDKLIKNACLLKTGEIIEMKYTGEGFLNDGIFELNKNIKTENLNLEDKKSFIKFYKDNLETNLTSCLEVNEGLKNIITYVNKNYQRIKNNTNISIYNIINEGGFIYNLNKELKTFLNDKRILLSKLGNLMIYLEKLYFKLAIEEQGKEYQENMDEQTKKKIEEYFNNKNGQLITEDKLSNTIVRFLLNSIMAQNKNKYSVIEKNDNLLDYISDKSFWDEKINGDERFINEIEEYKKLNILVKNTYDFYSYISKSKEFENELKEILENIANDKPRKPIETKVPEKPLNPQIPGEQQKVDNGEDNDKDDDVDDDDDVLDI